MSAAAATLSLVPPLTERETNPSASPARSVSALRLAGVLGGEAEGLVSSIRAGAASVQPAAAGVGKRRRHGEADTAGGAAQKKPRSVCPHQRQRSRCKECMGGEHLPAPAPKERMQGVRGGEHLPAPAPEEQMQGVQGGGHLPASAPEERIQGVRAGEHLPAPAPEEHMQGVRGGEHLPAPAPEEHM
jgi:hypothetical protein